MMKEVDNGHWQRFRIQWADFRNANRGKGSPVKPFDLIKLPSDDKVKENKAVPDMEAVKRKFGSKARSKVKKKHGDK